MPIHPRVNLGYLLRNVLSPAFAELFSLLFLSLRLSALYIVSLLTVLIAFSLLLNLSGEE
jgi:hypothetical protein